MKCPACGSVNIAGSDECENCREPLTDIEAMAPKRGMERRILDGFVGDLRPKPAPKVRPAISVEKAVQAMREAKAGCVLVLDAEKLVGIFSERELLLHASDVKDLGKVPVAKVMRPRPAWLKEDDQLADAFHQMAISGNRHIPVQFKDGSYGVVSVRNLLSYLCR